MSFILDALKKSEAERKRQGSPDLASIPDARPERSSSRWIYVVGGLLAINLAVLSVLLLRPSPGGDNIGPAPTSPATTPAEPAPQVARDETLAAASPAASPDLPQPEPESVPETAVEASRAADPPAAATIEDADVGVAPEPEIVPVQTETAGLVTLAELQARGVITLPDLHLDIHVYSGVPEDRFVFVNMSKYAENERLREGPSIREITPDGVVLDYQGTAFLLPRQ